MRPLVSVIMPLYNSGTTVLESIESVRAQSFKDWELVVADDGSTDDGPGKVRTAAEKDDRILFLGCGEHTSTGPSAARNRAVRESKGEYIAFLDADDLWLPAKLETQLGLMEKNPRAGMVWGPAEYFYSDRSYLQPTGIESSGLWKPPDLAGVFLKNLRGTPCPSGILMRRTAFDEAGGFDEKLKRGEDIAFCINAAARSEVYYYAPVLFRYRRHPESSTSRANRSGERYKEELLFHEWALRYMRQNPGMEKFTARAEDNYHAALHAAAALSPWPISRYVVFRGLGVFPGLRAKRGWRLLMDCFLPFSFSRRLSAWISRRIGV